MKANIEKKRRFPEVITFPINGVETLCRVIREEESCIAVQIVDDTGRIEYISEKNYGLISNFECGVFRKPQPAGPATPGTNSSDWSGRNSPPNAPSA